MEAVENSEKINCSVGAGNSGQGTINVSLVKRRHRTIASFLVFKMTEEETFYILAKRKYIESQQTLACCCIFKATRISAIKIAC